MDLLSYPQPPTLNHGAYNEDAGRQRKIKDARHD
jgi:hypothetical protein